VSLTLEIRNPATGIWNPPAEEPIRLGERARLRLTAVAPASAVEVRLYVGDVLMASSLWEDQAEYHLRKQAYPAGSYFVMGKFLRDWVGQTDLRLDCLDAGEWQTIERVGPIFVEPERLRLDEYEALCAAVAAESADLLADVYGKTGLSANRAGRGATGPAVVLQRVRLALEHLAAALNDIARQPAYRLRTARSREPAVPGQAVSELTLEEACADPGLAVAVAGRVRFREQIREVAGLTYRLPENQLLADFLAFLRQQLGDLRTGLRAEAAWRAAQRSYRDRPGPGGAPSWWESEDRPRIEECVRLIRQADAVEGEVNRLARYRFLPPGEPLTVLPASTPLVRSHRAYGSAYRVIAEHFAGHHLRTDPGHLVTRARSLPVLYEWWCALEVIRVVRGCFDPAGGSGFGRRLEADQGKYVVEFAPNQSLDFADAGGRLLRVRYQPAYLPPGDGRLVGLLGRGAVRTPDVAIEVFDAGNSDVPALIIVLDAKYTSAPHPVKLDSVKLKYDRIGEFGTGRVLGRQVWALVPGRPVRGGWSSRGWPDECTADNAGVFADAFDVGSSAVGVVHAAPLIGPGYSAVELLLRHLFQRCGLKFVERGGPAA
jgi:hypothetical protein